MASNDNNQSPTRVLVTGASGFVGSALVPLLLQAGWAVTVLTRDSHKNAGRWPSSVSIIEGDLAAEGVCKQAVAGIDAVVHLADLAHVRAGPQAHHQSLLNLQALAVAASTAGVKRFVYISSCKASYPKHSAYGRSKLAAEKFLLALGSTQQMQVVCLRPGIIYGVGMRNNLATLLALLRRPFLPVFPASQNPISMVSVEDCSRSILAALTHPALPGQVWGVNDGVRYSLDDLVCRIRHHHGLPLPRLRLARTLVWCLCLLGEALAWLRLKAPTLASYRVLYAEHYPIDTRFTNTSGVQANTDFSRYLLQQSNARIP